jgi:hypothetical protein
MTLQQRLAATSKERWETSKERWETGNERWETRKKGSR